MIDVLEQGVDIDGLHHLPHCFVLKAAAWRAPFRACSSSSPARMSDSVARTQDIREQLARVRLLALDPDHVDQHQATVLDEAFTSLRLWAEKEHDALHETTQELVKEWAEWIDRVRMKCSGTRAGH
jgi:hypothetical protein